MVVNPSEVGPKIEQTETKQVKESPYSQKSISEKAIKAAKSPDIRKAVYSQIQSPELKRFTEEKDAELKAILEGKEKSPEKKSKEKEILKLLDPKIEKTLPKGQDLDLLAKIIKNKEGKSFDNPEEAKEFLREQFLKGEVKEFNETNIDKDGKTIPSKREKLLKEEPFLENLDGKLLNEAAVIYGEETMKKLSPFLEKFEGKKLPTNLEELNLVISELIASGNSKIPKEQQAELIKELQENPAYLNKIINNDRIREKTGRVGNNAPRGQMENVEISGKGTQLLLDFISKAEGTNGNYNAIYGNAGANVELSNMSVREIIDYQKSYKKSHGYRSAAIGKYQFMDYTLKDMVDRKIISYEDKFTNNFQDAIATKKLETRGLNKFISGSMSRDNFQKSLSAEWASLPKDESNLSYYSGDGLNHALVNNEQLDKILDAVKSGEEYNSKDENIDKKKTFEAREINDIKDNDLNYVNGILKDNYKVEKKEGNFVLIDKNGEEKFKLSQIVIKDNHILLSDILNEVVIDSNGKILENSNGGEVFKYGERGIDSKDRKFFIKNGKKIFV